MTNKHGYFSSSTSAVVASVAQTGLTYPLNTLVHRSQVSVAGIGFTFKNVIQEPLKNLWRGFSFGSFNLALSRGYAFYVEQKCMDLFTFESSYTKNMVVSGIIGVSKPFLLFPADYVKIWRQTDSGLSTGAIINQFCRQGVRNHLGVIPYMQVRSAIGWYSWLQSQDIFSKNTVLKSMDMSFFTGAASSAIATIAVMIPDLGKTLYQRGILLTDIVHRKGVVSLFQPQVFALMLCSKMLGGGVFNCVKAQIMDY